jgi:hypothetical protein
MTLLGGSTDDTAAPPAPPATTDTPADTTTPEPAPAAPTLAAGALISHTTVDDYANGTENEVTAYGLVVGTETDDDGNSTATVAWLPPGLASVPVGDLTEL